MVRSSGDRLDAGEGRHGDGLQRVRRCPVAELFVRVVTPAAHGATSQHLTGVASEPGRYRVSETGLSVEPGTISRVNAAIAHEKDHRKYAKASVVVHFSEPFLGSASVPLNTIRASAEFALKT